MLTHLFHPKSCSADDPQVYKTKQGRPTEGLRWLAISLATFCCAVALGSSAARADDTTPPTLSILTPEDAAASRDLGAITGYAYDSESLVPTVELVIYQDGHYWDGSAWVDRPEGAPIPLALPKPQVDPLTGQWSYTSVPTGADVRSGIYYINASVYDTAGNANPPEPGISSRSFWVDRSAPTVTISAPLTGAVFTQVPATSWIQGSATDDGSEEAPVVTVYLKRLSDQQYWAGGTWTTLEIARALQTLSTAGNGWECSSPMPRVGPDLARCLAAGDYEVIATAADRAGNQAEVKVTFSVEHQFLPPSFSYLTAQETPLVPEGSVSTSTGMTLPPLAEDDPRTQSVRKLRVDAQGNYFTGVALSRNFGTYITPEPSTVLSKHSPTGEQIWRLERQKRSVTVQSEGLEVTHYYERFSDDQDWREIDGYTYDGMYSLGAMEMDAAGNVYAALNLYTLQYRQYATSSSGSPLFANIPTPVNHTLVVKFNSAGALVWRHVVAPSQSHQSWYPTSGAISVQPLADGSAIVLIGNTQYVEGTWYTSGYVLSQTVVARVGSATGSFAKHFGYGSDFDSYALDVAMDAEANVYLVTSEAPRSGNYFTTPPPEHVIRKLSDTGTLLREVRMQHADAPETWSDMAVDAATGHLYLAGNHTISYRNDGHQIALKFDLTRPEGQELVWRQFGPDNSVSGGMPVHLALSPNAVSLGSNGREQGSNRNVFTITRMSREGEFAWSRKYSTPQQNFDQVGDGIEALTADQAGNVYMLGNTPRADGLGQNVVRKISSFGDVQFAKPFPLESFVQENHPEVHLLPNAAVPSTIAVLAQLPEPGQVLLFSNPAVVFPPITIPAEEPADQVVSAGTDVTLTVNASGSAPLAYQWRRHEADGSFTEIPGARNVSLTFSNVQPTDGGRYSVEVSNGLAAPTTSRVMTLTVESQVSLDDALGGGEFTWLTSEPKPWRGQTAKSADGVAAAVAGTIGHGEATWLETTVNGPGTLTFQWQVSSEPNYDSLAVYLDGVQRAAISGEASWTQETLSIPAGTHTVRWEYAKDGSMSAGLDRAWLDEIKFESGPVGQNPHLLISIDGDGEVFEVKGTKQTLAQPSSERTPGEVIRLIAKPANGMLFLRWSVTGSPQTGSTNPTISTEMDGDLALTAHFIPNPFPALAGTYGGVIKGAGDSPLPLNGAFTVTVTSSGKASGKFTLGTYSVPVKLSLDPAGEMSGSVPLGGGASLEYLLQFTEEGVTGTLYINGEPVAELAGGKTLTLPKGFTSEAEGRYTLLLGHAEDERGYALAQVAKNGKVKVHGILPTGEAFSASSVLQEGNRAPLFTKVGKSGRALAGWLDFPASAESSEVHGTLLNFSLSDGEGEEIAVAGTLHNATNGGWVLPGLESTGGAATLTINFGDLPAAQQEIMIGAITAKGRKLIVPVTNPSGSEIDLKLTINLADGSFAGKFRPQPGAKFVKFSGVLLPGLNQAAGRFTIGDESGSVTITPQQPAAQ